MIDEHMSDLPLVSVILPSYNHAPYVREAMVSIERQNYPNIQFIIIDDASPDGSAELIAEFCNNKPYIYIRKQENEGVIKALNDGLSQAIGKYVAFFASDDIWHPDKIKKQVAELENNPEMKISFTEGCEIDQDGKILDPIKYSRRNQVKWYFDDVLLKADLPAMSIMARLADVNSVGGFSNQFKVEDLTMWLSLLQNGGFASVVKERLVYYRSHPLNTHKVMSLMVVDEHFKIIEYFSRGHPLRKEILDEWRLRNANMLASTDKKRSMQYLLPVLHKVFDIRLYSSLVKYVLK